MFRNVMLDSLPEEWNGYPIDADFQTGIQISQCMTDPTLSDTEKFYCAACLLFPNFPDNPELYPDNREISVAIRWFMTEYIKDNYGKSKEPEVIIMDWDIDQWRIYTAFLKQYGIDLNNAKLHWFSFMGLLSNLEECSFTRVMDIRQKKITAEMSAKEKTALQKAKKIFSIQPPEEEITPELQDELNDFMKRHRK